MSDMGKNLLLWLIIAAVLLTVFNNFNVEPQQEPVAYSEFVKAVNAGQIREAQIQGDKITALDGSGNRMVVVWPQNDDKLISELIDNNVVTTVLEPEKQSFWSQLLIASFPILIIIAVFMLFMRQMQGGGSGRGGPMAFGRSKAKLLSEDQIKTTFADVAGVDEAKEEVQELVEFLRDPGKFHRVPVKPCWQKPLQVKPKYSSSQFPVQTLSKCLSAWVHPAYETCLNRPRNSRPVLFSSMRLMLSVAIVVLALVAGMMSANRL